MGEKIRIAYFCSEFPVLSQTFIEREIRELARQGFEVEVHSCCTKHDYKSDPPPPEGTTVHHFPLLKKGKFLINLIKAFCREWRLRPFLILEAIQGVMEWKTRMNKQKLSATLWGVYCGLEKAKYFRNSAITHVHATWATMPATAAAVVALLANKSFSFGAHAYDLYRDGGDPYLHLKMKFARFIHTTTLENVRYLTRIGADPEKIVLARRGLDRLPELKERSVTDKKVKILSVGRLVPKKGHVHQIMACHLLRKMNVNFELAIVGDGELRHDLMDRVQELGLCDYVNFLGALSPEKVQRAYEWADIFWHTGEIDRHGDRDGLPNVIPEAFSNQLPVICSRMAGANEAVTHLETGIVVDCTDEEQLAKAVKKLIHDPDLRRRLSNNGRKWVEENFLIQNNVAILAKAFRKVIARRSGG
jgi:glycosyltransferase involved in cell wall biosynthesis